jgi:hypothetical protein
MTCTHTHIVVHHDILRKMSHAECTACHKEGMAYLWQPTDADHSRDYLGFAFDMARANFRDLEMGTEEMMGMMEPAHGDSV